MTTIVTADNAIFSALREARKELQPVEKGAENPFFQSHYMDLDSVKDAADPILDKHGLYITQFPDATSTGEPALTTLLVHESGDYISSTAALSLSKKDPQAQGSAITYMKRYSYVSILGIKGVDPDDDGNVGTLSDKQVTARGGKAEGGASSRAGAGQRKELEAAFRQAGFSIAKGTKWYHDQYGKDYKSDPDEHNLAAAIVKLGTGT